MKRAILPAAAFLLAACVSMQPMPRSYAVIVDPSTGSYASAVRAALNERLPDADFIDVVLPADKHEAIVVVRGIAAPPKAFEYEVYRNGVSVRSGQVPVTAGADHGARALAGDVERALRRR